MEKKVEKAVERSETSGCAEFLPEYPTCDIKRFALAFDLMEDIERPDSVKKITLKNM